MSASTIDFSRYAQQSAPPPTIDFSKYGQGSAAPAPDPGTLQKVWDWANRGVISGKTLLNVIGDMVPRPSDMKPGESTSDYLTRVQNKIDPDHPYLNAIRVGLAGVDKDAADTISSFTSPLALGTMAAGGAGKLPGAAGKAARAMTALSSAGFAAKGAGDVAHAATDDQEDLPTRVHQALQGAATLAGGAAGAAEGAPDLNTVKDSTTNAVRAGVRGANKVLAKAPGSVGATVGGAAGAATHIPGMAEVGAGAGYALGKELLPQVKLPGESFGLPKRVQGGPAVAPPYQPPVEAPAAEPAPAPTEAPTPAPDTSPKAIQQKLESALGGQKLVPGVPIKNQAAAMQAAAGKLPDGFTPVESSALKGYKYDPETREFESITTGGQHYIHGDVSPDEAQAFADAQSKGKAWQQIRQNPLVAKVVNGKRVPIIKSQPVATETETPESPKTLSDLSGNAKAAKAAPAAPSAPTLSKLSGDDDDLTALLQQSLQKVQQAKSSAPPQYIYRVRDAGEKGVPLNNSVGHATESLAEARQIAEHRQGLQGGNPQEIVRINLGKVPKSQYSMRAGPNGHRWFTFKKPIAETVINPVDQPSAVTTEK